MKLVLQACNFYLVVDERIGVDYMFDELFTLNIIVRQAISEAVVNVIIHTS